MPNLSSPVPSETLAVVATACHRNEQLRLDYLDRHHTNTRRQVGPHRLVHVSGRWYLVAYDLDRSDWSELLATYLGALNLDFHVDPDDAPELALAIDVPARPYTAATG